MTPLSNPSFYHPNLFISKGWNTVKDADNIVVLKHGNVVEQGKHNELEKKHGLYHSMVSKQRGT